MADNEIKISPRQARVFAYAIYRDVAAYVESHQEEYQEFLLKEETLNGENKATYRPKRGRRKTDRV